MNPRFGDVLIELGFITSDQLALGLERQLQDRRRLGEVLVSMGIIGEDTLTKALQRQTGVEEWDPRRTPVHERVIATFPPELAIRHRVFPVAIRRNGIGVTWCIATMDPTDETTKSELGKVLCKPDQPVTVIWFVAPPSKIEAAIQAHYSDARPAEELVIPMEAPVEYPSVAPGVPAEQASAQIARIRVARKSSVPGEPEGESN